MSKSIKHFLSSILIITILFSQAGCSCFRSGKQNFSVMTSDPEAKIYINNEFKGTGIVRTKVARNRSVAVRAEKDGYKPISRIIEKKLSTTGVLDTIGGWFILIPFIGLAFPGAYELEMSNVNLTFTKEDKIKK